MKLRPHYWRLTAAVSVGLLCALAVSCSDDDGDGDPGSGGAGGVAGTAGTAGTSGTGGVPVPQPGEQCFDPDPSQIRLRANPPSLVLAPGQVRDLEVVVDPDVCDVRAVRFETGDAEVAAAPSDQRIDLVTPSAKVRVTGGALGTTELKALFPRGDDTYAELAIPVHVLDSAVPGCAGSGAGRVDDGVVISGTGGLERASVGYQQGATTPNHNSYIWSVSPFDATLSCASDQVPSGFTKLGPAVSFGPADLKLPREIPFTVPANPAAVPEGARMRHVTVSYTGPNARTPRVVPVGDLRFVRDGDGYKLSFIAPWLGTYQAVVRSGDFTPKKRRITHRAIVGVSMGGGGTSMVGLRNHQLFDVLAPLGGPVEWTWLLGHIRRNHVGGFAPNDGTTAPPWDPTLPTPQLPYEHSSSFNRWWYEYPRAGNGGRFPREEYVQIFRDLALMFGNPGGYNPTPGAENLPAGVPLDHPSVVGDRANRECAVWVDPISQHPDEARQRDLARSCPSERCANTLRLTNYYDADFNPLGTFPVISFCDGSEQDPALSPYANTWSPIGNDRPMELALAVDYNDNGVRDENEPVIFQGYERFRDVGADGLASVDEPGYEPGVNEDPAGDDWHPQFNPGGTEGNFRYDEGEPFDDFGLDGVQGTASSPYDFGEGNGRFDYAPGYRTFLERDSRTVIAQHPMATQAQPLDAAALARLDLWTDGGTRDLFNFAVSAQALMGEWQQRGRIVQYFTSYDKLPGQVLGNESEFVAGRLAWEDIPGGVMMRYGAIDPTPQDMETGSGQHVGPADQVVRRLQSALYYIGSRWPDAPRGLSEASQVDPVPGAELCEVRGGCDFNFTDSRGRTGPVSVNFPPGYSNAKAQYKRYPVIYMLHGYGQTPEDLKAAIVFLSNWMNSPIDSTGTRLPQALLVYVDGRCRPGEAGDETECIRGTFFTDSVREKGPKMESWWMELVEEIDRRYRTMPPTEIDWVE
ncbi:MAG: hypothetical protein KIT72_04630 [Polyangiaceae bacterium]|nr:hypothetical protein [Polyangiaceae bacterium]MCW5789689.1 hypothetical protein [Polyangiaceae bacterium]